MRPNLPLMGLLGGAIALQILFVIPGVCMVERLRRLGAVQREAHKEAAKPTGGGKSGNTVCDCFCGEGEKELRVWKGKHFDGDVAAEQTKVCREDLCVQLWQCKADPAYCPGRAQCIWHSAKEH